MKKHHDYYIVVKVYGRIMEEYYPETYEEAQRIYYRTAHLVTCFTGFYLDGKLLNVPDTDKFLDPDGKVRSLPSRSKCDYKY